MRTVSLLPAATEIVAELGLVDDLVGISHECNFPEAVNHKPRVTSCEIQGEHISSRAIDEWVVEKVSQGAELFTLDEKLLRELRPELILTQRLCDVCAPAYGSVAAFADTLAEPPRVLNLEPSTLEDVFNNIRSVAAAMGEPDRGTRVIAALQARVEAVRDRARAVTKRSRVAVIEWLDPVFCCGHWTPQLVEIAGGIEVLGRTGEDSVRKTWEDVRAAEPEMLVIACCGQSRARALHDWNRLKSLPEVASLLPVRQGKVYATDGNAYFSRPGPRLVEALEMLAEIIHPELFGSRSRDCGFIEVR